jgi:hypothetical protein
MLIEKQNWLLTPAQTVQIRKGSKGWRPKTEVGKRPTQCRQCNTQIKAGESRISFKHFCFVTRSYDLQGFVHADETHCTDNHIVDALTDAQEQLLGEI